MENPKNVTGYVGIFDEGRLVLQKLCMQVFHYLEETD